MAPQADFPQPGWRDVGLDRAKRSWRAVRRAAQRSWNFASLPETLVAVTILAGSSCMVYGVLLLAGRPWAFIAAAAVLFVAAGLILRGMAHD